VFDYRVRLPRGLQHKLIPEIQIEVPAFEQTRSAVETQMIGGEIRSIYEQARTAEAVLGSCVGCVVNWLVFGSRVIG
jgi:hypothetical protein